MRSSEDGRQQHKVHGSASTGHLHQELATIQFLYKSWRRQCTFATRLVAESSAFCESIASHTVTISVYVSQPRDAN